LLSKKSGFMAQASKLFDLSERMTGMKARPAEAPQFHPSPSALSTTLVDPAPRKLVRPSLSENFSGYATAPRRLRGAVPLAIHENYPATPRKSATAASHAEALYFQKQIQTQTPLVFVLEDGEQIEWFDRDSLKVRNATRTLIFKRRIKYLYKAKEE
jgi:hypothetical protein